jgi:hypothetical protein
MAAVERVTEALKRSGDVECDAAHVHMFHAARNPDQNNWALSRFNMVADSSMGAAPTGPRILVTTDQARGLLPAATHVVMAELPTDGVLGWDARMAGVKVAHATTILDESRDAKHVVELVRCSQLPIHVSPTSFPHHRDFYM